MTAPLRMPLRAHWRLGLALAVALAGCVALFGFPPTPTRRPRLRCWELLHGGRRQTRRPPRGRTRAGIAVSGCTVLGGAEGTPYAMRAGSASRRAFVVLAYAVGRCINAPSWLRREAASGVAAAASCRRCSARRPPTGRRWRCCCDGRESCWWRSSSAASSTRPWRLFGGRRGGWGGGCGQAYADALVFAVGVRRLSPASGVAPPARRGERLRGRRRGGLAGVAWRCRLCARRTPVGVVRLWMRRSGSDGCRPGAEGLVTAPGIRQRFEALASAVRRGRAGALFVGAGRLAALGRRARQRPPRCWCPCRLRGPCGAGGGKPSGRSDLMGTRARPRCGSR